MQRKITTDDLDLTHNTLMSDSALFDENHMFLSNDGTTAIHDIDLEKMVEELKN